MSISGSVDEPDAPVAPPMPQRYSPDGAAFFDIDNTVMRGASSYFFARGLRSQKLLSTSDMMSFGWMQAKFLLSGTEDMDDFRKISEEGLRIVKGHHVDEMRAIANDVFDEYISEKLWPGTLALAQVHLDAGQQVWLVSATPVEIAQVIATRLDLTGALGTRAELKDGIYTGKLDGMPMHGAAKAAGVRDLVRANGFDLKKCSAYSDSANDIPMLSMVGNPVAVNPDSKLRAHAREADWEICDFRSRGTAWKVGIPSAAAVGLGVGLAVRAARRAR